MRNSAHNVYRAYADAAAGETDSSGFTKLQKIARALGGLSRKHALTADRKINESQNISFEMAKLLANGPNKTALEIIDKENSLPSQYLKDKKTNTWGSVHQEEDGWYIYWGAFFTFPGAPKVFSISEELAENPADLILNFGEEDLEDLKIPVRNIGISTKAKLNTDASPQAPSTEIFINSSSDNDIKICINPEGAVSNIYEQRAFHNRAYELEASESNLGEVLRSVSWCVDETVRLYAQISEL